MTYPGPEALGRSVVGGRGADAPDAWADAPRVVVGPEELARPEPAAILYGDFQTSIQRAGGEPSQVRRDDHVVELQQRFSGEHRLGREHI